MEKKTKLTISGGIAKKSIRNIDKAKNLGKNSVIIEKQTGKFTSRGGSFKSNPSKIKNNFINNKGTFGKPNYIPCLLYTSPSPRDISGSRMPSSA